jgi:hypothetical protein
MGTRERDDIGRLIFERTLQLIALDRLLREYGLPGVLAYPPAQLRALEARLLGSAPLPDATSALGPRSTEQEPLPTGRYPEEALANGALAGEAAASAEAQTAAPAGQSQPAAPAHAPAEASPGERGQRRLRQLRARRGRRATRIGRPGYQVDG